MNRRRCLKTLSALCVGSTLPLQALAGVLRPRAAGPAAGASRTPAQHADVNAFMLLQDGICRLKPEAHKLLDATLGRFSAILKTVGYGNFALLGFDDARRTARDFSAIGAFSKDEMQFLECLFYQDAARYGFLGDKPFKQLTDTIASSNVVKIPHTGNCLFKGRPYTLYRQMKSDIGDPLVLTSGIRGIAKQFYLFLNKTAKTRGRLSLAARSIAPPGYSYHGVGDFDVGQTGLGYGNFSLRFTQTDVYKQLLKLHYAEFRYPKNNPLGVRFEPWHIKTL